MIKIEYFNMPKGSNKISFTINYFANIFRTFYYFKIKYPWVRYKGFVRVMHGCSFAKFNIKLGSNVQFGPYCNISSDVLIGNYVLIAGYVFFIGKVDHNYSIPGKTIWMGERDTENVTVVEDDVWIGHNSIILAGSKIGKGSIVAAGSLVNKEIPPCEIWGGVPARKIKDRFLTDEEKERHIDFLNNSHIK